MPALLRALAAAALIAGARCLTPSILLPLYEWPGDDCWPDVLAAGAKHPSLRWTLILNPSSGPGRDAQDASYTCLPAVRKALPGATIVGYVRTDWAKLLDPSTVNEEIERYATYTDGGLNGIEAQDVALYQQYATLARRTSKSGQGYVLLNPGTATAAQYFDFADMIVTHETSARSLIVPAASSDKPRSKQAVIAYDQPSSSLAATLDTLFAADVPMLYLTSLAGAPNPYANRSPLFAAFVQGVADRSQSSVPAFSSAKPGPTSVPDSIAKRPPSPPPRTDKVGGSANFSTSPPFVAQSGASRRHSWLYRRL